MGWLGCLGIGDQSYVCWQSRDEGSLLQLHCQWGLSGRLGCTIQWCQHVSFSSINLVQDAGFQSFHKIFNEGMLLIIPDHPARIWNWDTYSSADPVCLKFWSPAHAFPVMSEGKKASLRAVNAAAVPKLYPPSFLAFLVRNDSFQVWAAPLVRNDKIEIIFSLLVS